MINMADAFRVAGVACIFAVVVRFVHLPTRSSGREADVVGLDVLMSSLLYSQLFIVHMVSQCRHNQWSLSASPDVHQFVVFPMMKFCSDIKQLGVMLCSSRLL